MIVTHVQIFELRINGKEKKGQDDGFIEKNAKKMRDKIDVLTREYRN